MKQSIREIERRFVLPNHDAFAAMVRALPKGYHQYESYTVYPGECDFGVVRARCKTYPSRKQYQLGIKVGFGLNRFELELPLDQRDWGAMWLMPGVLRTIKTTIWWETTADDGVELMHGLCAYRAVYIGDERRWLDKGLYVYEIESPSLAHVTDYRPPPGWVEVTGVCGDIDVAKGTHYGLGIERVRHG